MREYKDQKNSKYRHFSRSEHQLSKVVPQTKTINTDKLVTWHQLPKYLKTLCACNFQISLTISFPNLIRFPTKICAQRCPLLVIEKWKKAVDNKKVFGVMFTDLCEVFGCICGNLPVVNLYEYGLSYTDMELKSKD